MSARSTGDLKIEPGKRRDKKRTREDSSSPTMSTPRSPSKRTRKNSLGSVSAGATAAAAAAVAAAAAAHQKASAGPAGAGTPGAAPPPGTSAQPTPQPIDPGTRAFLLEMEKRLSAKVDKISDNVRDNTREIIEVKKDFNQQLHKRDVELAAKFEEHRRQTREDIEAAISERHAVVVPASRTISKKQEEEYNHARRSVRIYPIKGPNYAAAIRSFLMSKLNFTADALIDLGNMEVVRCRDPRPKTMDEVVVTFENKSARDAVKAAGVHLAKEVGCGMRIHVPGFLLDCFNLLQSLAYNMKQTDDDVRRSIKFNDSDFNLILDVKVGGSWRRITPEQARAVAAVNPNIGSGPKEMSTKDIEDFFKNGNKTKK